MFTMRFKIDNENYFVMSAVGYTVYRPNEELTIVTTKQPNGDFHIVADGVVHPTGAYDYYSVCYVTNERGITIDTISLRK